MKKSFVGIGLGVLLVAMASCSKTTTASAEDKLMGDSLAMAMGQVMGGQIKTQIDRQKLMYNGQSHINVEKLIRGMEAILYADTTDEMSYIQGVRIGLTLVEQPVKALEAEGFPISPEMILKGFKEAVDADSVSPEQLWQAYTALESNAKKAKKQRVIDENGKEGEEYVENVKKADPEVQTAESGLSYKIDNPGNDVRATLADTVLVSYKGSLINGTVFDDRSEGEPVKFPLKNVVKGFSEGLTKIGEGGKATLYIPGNLGYGDAGNERAGIAPNSTLVFDVNLVKVLPAALGED